VVEKFLGSSKMTISLWFSEQIPKRALLISRRPRSPGKTLLMVKNL